MRRISPVAVLLAAKAVSDVGFALDFVCLSVFVWVRTESALATSALGLCLYAGGVAGGRLGQRYGARWQRRRAMVTADVARAAVLAALVVLPGAAQMWWLFPAVFVVGSGRSVFESTLAAATPALAGSDRIQRVNSAISALKGLALVVGLGLATVAVPAVGFRGVFALDAASYALSAVVLLALPLRLRDDAVPAAAARRGTLGFAALAASGVLSLVVVRGLDAFGSTAHHVGLSLFGAVRAVDNPARVVGAVWMVWAIGTLAGSLGVRPLLARAIDRSAVVVFGVATTVMSAGFIGIFWLGSWPALLAAAAVAGVGDALSEITFKHALQALPEERRVGAFGTASMAVNVGFAAGMVTVGAVATPARVPALVLVMHGVAVVAAMTLTVRALRARAAGAPARAPVVAAPAAAVAEAE